MKELPRYSSGTPYDSYAHGDTHKIEHRFPNMLSPRQRGGRTQRRWFWEDLAEIFHVMVYYVALLLRLHSSVVEQTNSENRKTSIGASYYIHVRRIRKYTYWYVHIYTNFTSECEFQILILVGRRKKRNPSRGNGAET